MKKLIFKIFTLATFLIVTIIIASTSNVYAATSNYQLATYFTFSSDMSITKGFELIKPYILYDSSYNAVIRDYEFEAIPKGDGWFNYVGKYPDGQTFSISTKVKVIDSECGTFVEAQLAKNEYRQSIYVTNLKPGKTTSDCLMECWREKWFNVREPSYSIDTGYAPGGNIYNRMTSFVTGAGEEKTLCYYAIYDVDKYEDTTTPSEDEIYIPPDNNNDNNNQGEVTTPPDDDNSSGDNSNDDSNNGSNQQQPQTQEKDPVLIFLIVLGGVLLIVVGYMIYKVIRMVLRWLDE